MPSERASNVVPLPSRRVVPEDLCARLAARDRDAITEVYRRDGPKVRAYARRMLGDDALAEDVVHDVFVALPDAVVRFRGDAKLETFLVAIAVNVCRRRVRSSTRGRRMAERFERGEPTATMATPETDARRRELAGLLARGLETLTIEHREAFVLCAVEERSSPEVAAILDVPEGTVRQRLFHARQKLRAFLEAEGVR